MNFKERIVNGLYGQAVTDAVGNPFEFQTNINPDDVIAYVNNTTRLVISDDTQMSLFGMEAIPDMNCYTGDIYKKVQQAFTESYLDWYFTQKNNPYDHISYRRNLGLLSFESMYSVQAPGHTCLSALDTLRKGGIVENDSMGCGSVMRLLPLVTLFENYDYETVIKCAQITGAITHKHKDNDPAIRRYMEVAYRIINDIPVVNINPEVTNASQLGAGWIATECVEMAIWSYCTATSFEDLLARSVAHPGDSDSVGAISGSLWGLSGREVPRKYIEKLDALDAIVFLNKKFDFLT